MDLLDTIPLNHRVIIVTDGRREEIPALDAHWLEKRPLTKYYPPPVNPGKQAAINKQAAALEEWLFDTECFRKDLDWLLQMEFHKFWSHVVFDARVVQAIASFFQEASPSYNPLKMVTSNEKVLTLYGEILKKATTTFCRFVTARESDIDWMSKEFLADILYSNYIISIPMIFDIIVTLGIANQQLLARVLNQLFRIQPNYLNDLRSGLEYIQLSLRSVAQQVECFKKQEINDPSTPEAEGLESLALYILDTAATLHLILDIVPNAQEIGDEIKITFSISRFYDECVPQLYELIYENSVDHNALNTLNSARMEFINAFHGIVNFVLETLLSGTDESEKLVNILEESMDHSWFVVDYQKLFPVENTLDIVRQKYDEFNVMRLDYLQVGYQTSTREERAENVVSDEEPEETQVPQMNGNAAEPIVEFDGKIRQIIDVFPLYGEGYVRKLLARYDDNAEAVITAIVEGNLPPDLQNSPDKSEPYIPPEQSEFFVETGIKRLNIYDGDEYDVMTNDHVKGIHKKGVGEPKHWETVLNDKTHIQPLRQRYEELGLVEETYDDEYDDSYDAMAESEAKTVKISAARNVVMDEVESDEEERVVDDGRDRSKDFCENPEAARARYEQFRATKFGPRKESKKELVGKPKGQGQAENTEKSRKKKEANKSSSANHNRKKAAGFKQSRGMF